MKVNENMACVFDIFTDFIYKKGGIFPENSISRSFGLITVKESK